MVVGGTTGQLLKCTKNISTSTRFSIFNNYLYDYKTNVHSKHVVFPRLASFSCDCRRFHYTDFFQNSRETRTTFTKLSPQEVSVIFNSYLIRYQYILNIK